MCADLAVKALEIDRRFAFPSVTNIEYQCLATIASGMVGERLVVSTKRKLAQ